MDNTFIQEDNDFEVNNSIINNMYSLRRTLELRVNNEYLINSINFEEFEQEEFKDVLVNLNESEFNKLNNIILDESTLKNKECCICLDKLSLSNQLIILKCNHIYHKNCIKNWFNHSIKCPICRYNVRDN